MLTTNIIARGNIDPHTYLCFHPLRNNSENKTITKKRIMTLFSTKYNANRCDFRYFLRNNAYRTNQNDQTIDYLSPICPKNAQTKGLSQHQKYRIKSNHVYRYPIRFHLKNILCSVSSCFINKFIRKTRHELPSNRETLLLIAIVLLGIAPIHHDQCDG